MLVLAFDRDRTVDVNPHPRRDAVPLECVRFLVHEGDFEVSVPSFGSDDNWIVQQFRQVSVKQALDRLPV